MHERKRLSMVASERWQLPSLPSRLPSETRDDLPLPGRRVKIQSPLTPPSFRGWATGTPYHCVLLSESSRNFG